MRRFQGLGEGNGEKALLFGGHVLAQRFRVGKETGCKAFPGFGFDPKQGLQIAQQVPPLCRQCMVLRGERIEQHLRQDALSFQPACQHLFTRVVERIRKMRQVVDRIGDQRQTSRIRRSPRCGAEIEQTSDTRKVAVLILQTYQCLDHRRLLLPRMPGRNGGPEYLS
ncbi:MAG TPA: hypothetical protein PLE72_08355 [Azospira sp.]|nr:hypothetical protein [Azospira sp.]HNN46206.1 hypothetical protein [Azospira sp.]